jgi:hypothetical protein
MLENETVTRANFWSRVFARRVRNTYRNETFQAHQPGVAITLEKHCCDVLRVLDYCINSDDAAWYFFEYSFSRLNPNQQLALSGFTKTQWLDLDRLAEFSE